MVMLFQLVSMCLRWFFVLVIVLGRLNCLVMFHF